MLNTAGGAIAGCILTLLSLLTRSPAIIHQPPAAAQQSPARIAILGALPPLTDGGDAAALAAFLRKQGHDAIVLSAVQLSDVNSFSATSYQLLIVPHSDVFPVQAQP